MTGQLPQPRETPLNAPLLAAWREDGALALQRCEDCGRAVFYPRALCPHCWSPRLAWFRASGSGRVVSFSIIHRGLPAAFAADLPILLAEIALAEDVTMIARIIADPDRMDIGLAVHLVDTADAARYELPTFRPADDG